MKLDVMWRPQLPELKAGKADTDCPDQNDYCEVCDNTEDSLHALLYID